MKFKELITKLFKKSDDSNGAILKLDLDLRKGDTKKEKTVNKSSKGAVTQIVNSGTINHNYNTIYNNVDSGTHAVNSKKENENDEQIYRKYYNCLNLNDMHIFIDALLSGSVWGKGLNDKVLDFLELVTNDSVDFFFDKRLEDKRSKLVDACEKFLEELVIQSGPYHNVETFSLRDEAGDSTRLKTRINKMTPLARDMYEAYHDFVLYARKERRFI